MKFEQTDLSGAHKKMQCKTISYDHVRRAAKHSGLIARKSRSRGYMLLDWRTRACVAGSWHDYPPKKPSPGSIVETPPNDEA